MADLDGPQPDQLAARRDAKGRFPRLHPREDHAPCDLRAVSGLDRAAILWGQRAIENVLCPSCGWWGTRDQLLSAPNPFVTGELLYACPCCRQHDSVAVRCSHDGCLAPATCGTPTNKGTYEMVCGFHYRQHQQQPSIT